MDDLTEIAQSLSHYIVILLVGYRSKQPLGERTPMPNVWIQRLTPDIIVNIWSFESRSRALMMIPNSKVDHTIIISDPGRDLKGLITEFAVNRESTTVITSNKDDQLVCREQGVQSQADLNDTLTRIATEIYSTRVKEIDAKILETLRS